MPRISRLPYLIRITLLVVLYLAAAVISYQFTILPNEVTALWLPSGVTLAAILYSRRLLPGVALASFTVTLVVTRSVTFAIAVALGESLEALVGAYLLRRVVNFKRSMERPRDVLGLVLFAAGLSTSIAATIGTTGLCISGMAAWNDFLSNWWVWWLGNAIGVLIAAPLILIWTAYPRVQWDRKHVLSAALMLVALAVVSWLIFTSPLVTPGAYVPVYLTFPFLIWAAVSFSQREVVSASLICSMIATWGTTHHAGPFVDVNLHFSMLMLSAYVATVTVTTMLLAALFAQRERAREALHLSEERFHRAFDLNNSALTLSKLQDGQFTDVNRSFTEILGYSRDEVIGKSPIELNLWVNLADREQIFALLRAGQPLRQVENQLRTKSGKIIDARFSVDMIEVGSTMHLLGIMDDVTEHKRAESALKAQEQFLRQVIDANPHPIFVKDAQGKFLLANKALAETMGTTVEYILGKTDAELNPNAEEVARYRHDDADVLRTLQPKYIAEEPATYADGELHWHQAIKLPMLSPEGQHQILGVALDITAYKRAEEALKQSEERFAQAFHASPSAIFITQQKTDAFVDVNHSFLEVTGYTREEVIGHTASELSLYPIAEEQAALIRELTQQRTVRNYDRKIRIKSGEICSVLASVELIRLAGEDHLLTMFQDITERKNAEEALKQLNLDLERHVAERTAELTAANVRLKELDRLKSKFIADVSHELRNPLTALITRIYLLERTTTGMQSEYISSFKDNVMRLANFVEHILDLSRLEARVETMQYEMVDLNVVTAHVVDALMPRAELAELELTFQPDLHLPTIAGVYNQLIQVVTNLVSNAINYTQQGSIRVRTSVDAQQQWVSLHVADTGMGINPVDLPYLFERFYRGQQVVQENIPGSGLGLGIVKEIVDLHAGSITVESTVGQGTVFEVKLPVKREPIISSH